MPEPVATTWQNPVAVSFGAGTLAGLGGICARLGGPVLLVTDEGLADGPIVAAARESLERAGAASATFTGVVPHPGLGVVEAAAEACRSAGAVGVVGLGGGSSMDVAKVAAAALGDPGLLTAAAWDDPSGLVAPGPGPGAGRAPFLAQVPTTPATGAEVTAVASITDRDGAKRLLVHPLLRARIAVIDPALHAALTPQRTAEASGEEVGRILGLWLTERGRRPLADGHAAETLRVVLERTPTALRDPGDLDARGDLALATTSTQLGWETFGRDPFGNALWYVQHALAGAGGITKGAGLSGLLPAYLRAVVAGRGGGALGTPGRLAELGSRLGLGDAPDAVAAALLEHLAGWGLPTSLAALGLGPGEADALTRTTLAQWSDPAMLGGLGADELHAIYADALEGAVP